ncbi:phosphate acetyltransferase [Psychromarinibacter sp. S121]|uniref:phosphate acetyltransferase n=1 Tax=Psychromarinibacter sp. S121 TaxID=3415127 RepID=UPI003C7E227A
MIKVGQAAETRRRFAPEELAVLGVEGRVPEPLLATMISTLLGMHLPGQGTNYLKQELAFPQTAPPDAEIVARVEVTRLRPETRLVDLWATCHADGVLVCEGRSLVKAGGDAIF